MLFKYNKPKPMTRAELQELVQDYKRKLWAHLEERQSSQLNQKFISFVEFEIEKLNKKLKNVA